MKKVVIYSSKTGNTKKVGEAIANELGCEIFSFENDELKIDEYDFIAIGYYIDKGGPDALFKHFLNKQIKDKKVGLFITLGTEPQSEYSKQILIDGRKFLEKNGNKIIREFICQGAIDPNLIEQMIQMAQQLKDKAPYPITDERRARWAMAASHPDENDLRNARKAFSNLD